MTEHSIRNSYSHQFASRQPTTIEKRDTIIGNKQSKSSSLWKNKHDTAFKGQKKSVQAQKTLIDALKQHGMRLCDGARLNAVGKGIHLLGYVPPTVSASITALYLSQNNLRSLEGIDQFAAVRLLSIGGNLISSDMEVERLTELAQLRNLNLMGNPVCDLPNYRLRAIAILTKLQVLDNADVTKKERALAPDIAAQDHALRSMVTQNHFNIQKLQRIAQLISLHKSFYAYVMAGIATGKFDRVPNPKDVACNIPLLLRLWKYEDTMSREEQESLEIQMLTIVMRTHARLAENPKEKAKDYLRKLASGSLSQLSDDLKQHCLSWEEAYTNVITLQQKTTANLLAICEKNRSQMVNYLKELLATDPIQRNETADCRRREQNEVDSEVKPFWSKTQNQGRMWLDSRSSERLYPHNDRNTLHSNHRQLPPQQIDPETRNRQSLHSHLSGLSASSVQKNNQVYADSDFHDLEISVPPARELRSSLRGGDFANKSLGEAIHDFKLRDSAPRMRGLQQPCKIRRTNFSQQQVDISLPQRLSSEQFPSERQNCSARLQKRGHKLNLSYCNTDVVSDFNDGELTPSTPSNLDLKSTSASSRAPISPVRNEGVPSDETSVPLAKISLKSHAHAQCASGSEPILSPRRPYLNYDEQLDESDHLEPVTALHDGRFQELEQREEKYIRALMQSEQRELDLRNNLSNVQRKLHSYQQTLAQQLHERETIKDEMAQRTVSIATPKILKRYFVRWIHYCNWSHQICHIRRKRCFIVQHDRFWQWRRKVWRQQEVRHCLRRRQRKLQKSIFIEWINCTRITVIAKRNQLVRETQFLNRVFQAWIYGAAFLQNKRVASRKQQVRFANQCQCSCFREWKRTTRIKRALERMQHLRWQDLRRISAQTVFWNWKLYLFSIARLLQHRATQFKTRIQFRQKRLHFQEWHKLRIIDKVHNIRLRRRMWTRWVTWRRHVQTAENGVHKAKLGIKNAYFCAWQLTASEQATSRRSLNLAKRYVNRRRLRKLWTYWKYFSMAKRKYTQNSTKAFKHYFIRLLRASWGAWKAQAQFNLQNAKTSKYGALERHFDAFLTGIRLVRVQQARKKMIMHAVKRRQWSLLRNVLQIWRGLSTSRKRCKQHAQTVTSHRNWTVSRVVWRRWRTIYEHRLFHQLKVIRNAYDSVLHEKHELEAHLQAAKNRAGSLSNEIKNFRMQSEDEAQHAENIKLTLERCEERNISLENELRRAKASIEQERHAWEDALCDEKERRESESSKSRTLAQGNQQLQAEVLALKKELQTEKASVIREENTNEELRAASETAANFYNSEMTVAMEKHQELERELAELRSQLKEKEEDREEIANRLQEYEKRIASTCEAMKQHEQAHEREKERLRDECATIEAKWKEEQVKYTALNRLLLEKNELILNMTSRLNHAKNSSCTGRLSDPSKHLDHGALYNDQDNWSQNDGCQKHLCRQSDRASNRNDCFQSLEPKQSHSPVSTTLSATQCRRTHHAFSVHPMDECTRSGKLQEKNAQVDGSQLDIHTSKVHRDIRLLQERITKRLEQAPAYANFPTRLDQRVQSRHSDSVQSLISSCSSLSDNFDSDTALRNKSVATNMRRARFRRFQKQKEAKSKAASPRVPRLASRAHVLARNLNQSDSSAFLTKPSKKMAVRKSKICGDAHFS